MYILYRIFLGNLTIKRSLKISPKISIKKFTKIFTKSKSLGNTLIIETIDKIKKEECKQTCISKIYAEDSDFFYYLDLKNSGELYQKPMSYQLDKLKITNKIDELLLLHFLR